MYFKHVLLNSLLLLYFVFLIPRYESFSSNFFHIENKYKLFAALSNEIQSSPHWLNGLSFGCTGCGKCCQNEGEVWLDAEEYNDMTNFLGISSEEFMVKYVELVMSGWAKLKSQPFDSTKNEVTEKCIFLDENGLKCTICEARPIQCKTYPYW